MQGSAVAAEALCICQGSAWRAAGLCEGAGRARDACSGADALLHWSSCHSQQERTQGLERKALQALLKHPAFVEAVHGVLQPYSRVMPALAMPVQELARRLGAAAAQLAFVQRCHTRLQFSDSRAVRAPTHSLAQVRPSRTACARSHKVAPRA